MVFVIHCNEEIRPCASMTDSLGEETEGAQGVQAPGHTPHTCRAGISICTHQEPSAASTRERPPERKWCLQVLPWEQKKF